MNFSLLRDNPLIAPIVYIILISLMVLHTTYGGDFITYNEYFRKNFASILLVVVIILGIIMFFQMMNIDLNPIIHKQLNKIVTIESMNNKGNGTDENDKKFFCEHHKGKNEELEKDCNKFTKANCNSTSCCVWAIMGNGNEKCVAGNRHGPIYHTDDDGKDINFDAYYYQNKCHSSYGKCPNGEITKDKENK